MTEPDRKFEEEIRRALYAAGDLIVPAGDGLNKIRERAARRPPVLGWLFAYAAHLPRQLARGGRTAASEVAAATRGYSSLGLVLASVRRWPGKAGHALRTPSTWLRPVMATATALILVTGVTLSIPRLRDSVTAQLDSALGNSTNQGPGGGSGDGSAVGITQSSTASPMPTGEATAHMSGEPFLATMSPGSSECRDQGSGGTSGTVAERTNAGAPSIDSAVGVNAASRGELGPQPVSVTCPASTASAKPSAAPPVMSSSTIPYTPPPTTPVITTPATTPPTTPPTTPVTTPPTTPVTTPPTTTPVTTPPTTTPQTNTSSANSTETSGPSTETTPTPGG